MGIVAGDDETDGPAGVPSPALAMACTLVAGICTMPANPTGPTSSVPTAIVPVVVFAFDCTCCLAGLSVVAMRSITPLASGAVVVLTAFPVTGNAPPVFHPRLAEEGPRVSLMVWASLSYGVVHEVGTGLNALASQQRAVLCDFSV